MIEIRNLQKVVGEKTVLAVETLDVPAGEIAALVGPVDSGMDILFGVLIGRSLPTLGEVRLGGVDPFAEKAEFSEKVGVLFAENNLYQRQSAQSNLGFYCRLWRLPKSRPVEVLAQIGLVDQANTQVETLSSSLVRRLAFGRAILHRPSVLLLEEPFGQCDEISVSLLSKVMRQLAADGAAILIFAGDATHLDLCDVIHRLEKGRIVESFSPQERQRSDLPFMIPARSDGTVILVDPVDILFACAVDDRTVLQTAEGRLPTQFTLAELERRLAPSGFFRAHRSYLVNLQQVREVIPYTRDSFSLRLKDAAGTKIPLSKSAARELRELFDY